jgi:hypothetical protein
MPAPRSTIHRERRFLPQRTRAPQRPASPPLGRALGGDVATYARPELRCRLAPATTIIAMACRMVVRRKDCPGE